MWSVFLFCPSWYCVNVIVEREIKNKLWKCSGKHSKTIATQVSERLRYDNIALCCLTKDTVRAYTQLSCLLKYVSTMRNLFFSWLWTWNLYFASPLMELFQRWSSVSVWMMFHFCDKTWKTWLSLLLPANFCSGNSQVIKLKF